MNDKVHLSELYEEEPITEEAATEEESAQNLDLNQEMKVGYVVGVMQDGSYVFQIVGGKEKTLMELLGLHEHAGKRIQLVYDTKEAQGEALLRTISNQLSELNTKLDMNKNKL